MRPRAHLEQVKNEGLVSGWCWDESRPDHAVRLVVLVDGQPVGSTVANLFRPDLAEAGMGDGHHAFSYLIPWDRIAAKSVSTIGLIDEASGEALDTTFVFRRTVVLTIEDRLRDVEQQLRLLGARLDETTARAAQDSAMMAGVFATIGAFFTRLSELPPAAVPVELGHSVAGLLDSTRAQCPPFSFTQANAPLLTLCVDGGAPVQTVYACLRQIHETGLDRMAEVVLIDDGQAGQTALLPAFIGNLRYQRLQSGQSVTEARNQAVLFADRPFAGFLSSGCRVTPGWFNAVQAEFAGRPEAAVIGTGLAEAGPALTGPLADFLEASEDDGLTPITATLDAAMIIRSAVFKELGGFDSGFVAPTAAAINLCLRAWETGYGVYHLPAPVLLWQDEGGSAAAKFQIAPDIADLLAYRAESVTEDEATEPQTRVLIVSGAGFDQADLRQTVFSFQAQGLAVSAAFAGTVPPSAELIAFLHESGCAVIDTTQASGYDVLYLTVAAFGHPALPPQDSIAPRMVLALDAAAEERLSTGGRTRPGIKAIRAAIDAADCVRLRSAAGAAKLASLGNAHKIWRIGADDGNGLDRSPSAEDVARLLAQLGLSPHDADA
ncbi:glycosyltransferase family protein [Acidisoma silvae]|uniref:Glycosyltransferase n=1 Tax=Acidisoma silvae TaxID=2802396 RepID=A0A964DXE6_9PROT|nr:hypothetical protein [Acidisoma silvae]MCB8873618.1 hypothetical protein [Acidisoma silvae]